MSWDKFFTSRPVASLLKRAVSWVSFVGADTPFILSGLLGDLDWVAEVRLEQWFWFWIGWLGILSVSPLASLSTSSGWVRW
jgi:hypothetical protein